jgi:AcrR family transcriptional regulator
MPRKSSPSPRKLPVQARSVASVAAILEAAAHILERDGFGGYTTNAIAMRAGVSIGSLYQYFPNKDAVTVALIEQKAERNFETLQAIAAAQRSAPFDARIDALVRFAVAQQLDRPMLARRIDIEEARLGKSAAARAAERASGELVAQLLEEPGRTLPFDAATCVADLIAIVQGLTDAAGAQGDTGHQALTRRVFHAVTGYLRPRSAD